MPGKKQSACRTESFAHPAVLHPAPRRQVRREGAALATALPNERFRSRVSPHCRNGGYTMSRATRAWMV